MSLKEDNKVLTNQIAELTAQLASANESNEGLESQVAELTKTLEGLPSIPAELVEINADSLQLPMRVASVQPYHGVATILLKGNNTHGKSASCDQVSFQVSEEACEGISVGDEFVMAFVKTEAEAEEDSD